MPAQPLACLGVFRAGGGDKPPVGGRMVHPPQMHELVDEDVVPHRRRHQHQTPVQADVSARAAGSPPRTLVANAHARDDEAMLRREFEQARRQLAASLFAIRAAIVDRPCLP